MVKPLGGIMLGVKDQTKMILKILEDMGKLFKTKCNKN